MDERLARREFEYSIATLPPTRRHRQRAFLVAVVTLIAYGAAAAFSTTPLPRIDSFIPTISAIAFITDLVTAVLLFSQFSAVGSRALLVLGSGYLFSSLIAVGYALAFPGAFAPANPLGVGPLGASWLYVIWRLGLAVAMVGYISLTGEKYTKGATAPSARSIFWGVTIALGLVCAFIWGVTAGDRIIPPLITSGGSISPLGQYVTALIALMNVIVLVLLWARGRSVLDLWLMVAVCALTAESLFAALSFTPRYSATWYSIRLISLLVSKVVLIALLSESLIVQARLAAANSNLQRERENRLMTAGAVVAAIAHEVGQFLAGTMINAAAGKKSLDRASPDIAGLKVCFDRIMEAGKLAHEVFQSFLSLVKGDRNDHLPVNINALTLEAIHLLHRQLHDFDIEVHTMLAPELPAVQGNRGQLREVLLNLAQNSIDAMATTTRQRVMNVVTSHHSSDSICISFEDTGPGIDPHTLTSIFDPFVTTKAKGTGLGLAICKMIVEQHGGDLSAVAGMHDGARFEVTLPVALGKEGFRFRGHAEAR